MNANRAFVPILLAVAAPLLDACAIDATEASDRARAEETASVEQAFGDPPPCKAFVNGKPNPEWPGCLSGGPSLPPPSCSGISTCYCVCRWNHRCDTTPSQCVPLSQCLNGCDAQYPNCPTPGGGFPPRLASCYTGGG